METKELTNELLKEKMPDAMVFRGGGDFNTCLTPGHYIVNAENWINHPKGAFAYGTLLVYGDSNSFLSQEYITHNHEDLFWRTFYKPYNQAGSWDAWKMISGVKLT